MAARPVSLLSPELVDAVVAGRKPAHITLASSMGPFPADQKEQQALWSDVDRFPRAKGQPAR